MPIFLFIFIPSIKLPDKQMKKHLFILLTLISYNGYSQTTSSLPSNLGSLLLFKDNPVTLKAIFPSGYISGMTVSSDVYQLVGNSGTKIASISPTTILSGDTVKVTLSAIQVSRLSNISGSVGLFIKFNGVYLLGSTITVRVGVGANSTISNIITLPDIGQVKINLIGDTGTAQRYAHLTDSLTTITKTASINSQTQASLAIAAANTATSLSTTSLKRNPYGLINQLRSNPDTSYKAYNVIDKGKEGTFVYNPSSFAVDDSSTVILSGGRRFELVYDYLTPEQFGAIPGDTLDDSKAIQKMFNKSSQLGLSVKFKSGEYLIGKTIKFKNVTGSPTYNYKLNITGEGAGITIISGYQGFTGNMFQIDSGATSGGVDNFITIQKIHFKANQASRIFYAVKLVGTKFYDNIFSGGESVGIEIGLSGASESYSVYFKNNYHHGSTFNGGQNSGLLKLINARFFIIEGMETDGGLYGLQILGNSDKNQITHGKFEGAKKSGISITGSGGGQNRISSNYFQPYVGSDPNAQFTGEISAIEILSTSGSNANNSIENNSFFTIPSSENPLSGTSSNKTGIITPKAGGYLVTGRTSGAIGRLTGYNPTTNRWNIYPESGTFVSGEYLDQVGADGSTIQGAFQLATIDSSTTYNIKLTGNGGYNLITSNHLRGFPTYGVYSTSDGNNMSFNYIEALNGIYSTSNATIIGNRSYSVGGTSFASPSGSLLFSNNITTGGTTSIVDSYIPSLNPVVSNLKFANTVTPVSAEGASIGTSDNYFLNVRGVNFFADNYFARTTSGIGFTTSAGLVGLKIMDSSNTIIQNNGTFTDLSSAVLQVNSTSKGALLPRMTTTQRDSISSPAEGIEIYNTTVHTKQFYNGTVWKTVVTD